MKKSVFLLFVLISFSAFSQSGKPPRGERPEGEPRGEMPKKEKVSVDDQVARMTKELKLNDKQQLEIREILKDEEKNRNISFSKKEKNDDANREEMKAKMDAEREASDKKFKKILTSEQYTEWNKKRDDDQKGKLSDENGDRKKSKRQFTEK